MKEVTLYKIKALYRDDLRIKGYVFGKGKKALCIAGPMRGNEVQQLYVCSQLVKKFKQLEEEGRIASGKKIMIIPCINPYSFNTKKRFWCTDNTDINRMFPGYDLGETTQRIADAVFKAISDYPVGIQFTSYYMPGEFLPHIQMMDAGFDYIDMAKQFEMPYVVKRKVRPYDTTTLNYNWQIWNSKAFSFYTTSTERIDRASAGQAVLSILSFLAKQDIVRYNGPSGTMSRVISDTDMVTVQTARSGIFEAMVEVGQKVRTGTPLANILDPYEGRVLETLYAPCSCTVFFMHCDPLTYADTQVFKLVPEE